MRLLRDSLKEKADFLEEEARHTKEQLSELSRTANDYSFQVMFSGIDASRSVIPCTIAALCRLDPHVYLQVPS